MSRLISRPTWPVLLGTTGVLSVLLMPVGGPSAQQIPKHLNPVIEKLERGETVFGIRASDLSPDNARAVATSGVDYVRIDMEHGPMDVSAVRTFLQGMLDKAAILGKGNAQANVAPFVRIPASGFEESNWIVKQMLDQGVMGIIFPYIETREQALSAVRRMRYPSLKGSPYSQPAGIRGIGEMNAVWWWGIPGVEYRRRADVWPLNPEGDLLTILMIETPEGVKNADAIMSAPGVGAIFVGCCGDLPRSLGVPDNTHPEAQEALQTIVRACLRNKVPCWYPGAGTPELVQSLVKQGWRSVELGGSLSEHRANLMKAGRAVAK